VSDRGPSCVEDLGLRHESPRERSAERRDREVLILTLFSGGGAIVDPVEVCRAFDLMALSLSRISRGAVEAAITVRPPTVKALADFEAARVNDVPAPKERRGARRE